MLLGSPARVPCPRSRFSTRQTTLGCAAATLAGSCRRPGVRTQFRRPQTDQVRSIEPPKKAPAWSTLHALADEGVRIRAIAEVIGRHLDVPVVAISPENAIEHFAWLAGESG